MEGFKKGNMDNLQILSEFVSMGTSRNSFFNLEHKEGSKGGMAVCPPPQTVMPAGRVPAGMESSPGAEIYHAQLQVDRGRSPGLLAQ